MDIKELQTQIIKFRDERNWQQFHSLKDLLLGLNIECAELSELFLWKSESEIKGVEKNKIENEIADIYIFLNYLSQHFDIDIEKAVSDKIKINSKKYPVEKSFGSNKKYDEL
jgi:NTP pyrophosphatase (non-canonical NTP hydrolase)